MIRLVLLAVAAFILWVLFFSSFTKKQKITISVCAFLISVAGLWFEQAGQTPKEGLISVTELVDCGVKAHYSYRTNYDVEFCLRNNSQSATVKRAKLTFSVLSCPAGECVEIQSIDKEMPLSLAPGASTWFKENLDFNKVGESTESLIWVATVVFVKATK